MWSGEKSPESLEFDIIGEKPDGSTYAMKKIIGFTAGKVRVIKEELKELTGLKKVWVAAWDNAGEGIFGGKKAAYFIIDDLRVNLWKGTGCYNP